jgi:uncharacterized protein YggE
MTDPRRTLSAALLPLILSGLFVLPVAAQETSPRTVTVSGEGTVTAQPDQAVVRFGVVTRAETAQEARAENATAAKNAMNAVRALDIPDEQLRMETLRLQPRREYNPETKQREEQGYEATRQVVVELGDLKVLPQLVADVVEGGANRLDAIEYQLSDRSRFRDEALREAAESARDKAGLLAETLEADLGPVRTINEQNFDFVRPRPQTARMEMAKAADAGQAEPEAYAAGEIEVSAQVQVVFDLVTGTNR